MAESPFAYYRGTPAVQAFDLATTLHTDIIVQASGDAHLSNGGICAWALARAHARTGDSVAITAYLGTSDTFDGAIADFSEAYADENAKDHAAYVAAIKAGRVSTTTA